MAAPIHRGEVSIALNGVDLDLRFKSLNMMTLTELTGKSPAEYFERFEGADLSDAGTIAKKVCDFAFVVPLVMAGLADNDAYSTANHATLKRKICRLMDAEAETKKISLLEVVGEIAGKILPYAVATLNVASSEPDEGNAQPPVEGDG